MATPFLKWAGGKQALLPQLQPYFPTRYARYMEPFVGGGGVFFGLEPAVAILGDTNTWLMDTYWVVRERPGALCVELDRFVNTREAYLQNRALDPATLDPVRRAALLIYLNKTCFRGLFRMNRQGRFNVPYGDYQRPYYTPADIQAASQALQSASFRAGPYTWVLDEARRGDFVYLDPPYAPASETADFDRYTAQPFRAADHVVLRDRLVELDRRGVRWALSGRDTPELRALYDRYSIHSIHARREINLDASARSETELLILNTP